MTYSGATTCQQFPLRSNPLARARESFGDGFEHICGALLRLARRGDAQIVYPVHRNPHVLEPVHRLLGGEPNILLLDPLDYIPFVDLDRKSTRLNSSPLGISYAV